MRCPITTPTNERKKRKEATAKKGNGSSWKDAEHSQLHRKLSACFVCFLFFLWFRTFTSIAWWMDVRVFPATPHHPPLIEQQKQARLQDTHTHTQKTEAKQNQKEGGGKQAVPTNNQQLTEKKKKKKRRQKQQRRRVQASLSAFLGAGTGRGFFPAEGETNSHDQHMRHKAVSSSQTKTHACRLFPSSLFQS